MDKHLISIRLTNNKTLQNLLVDFEAFFVYPIMTRINEWLFYVFLIDFLLCIIPFLNFCFLNLVSLCLR